MAMLRDFSHVCNQLSATAAEAASSWQSSTTSSAKLRAGDTLGSTISFDRHQQRHKLCRPLARGSSHFSTDHGDVKWNKEAVTKDRAFAEQCSSQ
jgi:hypothetical protein